VLLLPGERHHAVSQERAAPLWNRLHRNVRPERPLRTNHAVWNMPCSRSGLHWAHAMSATAGTSIALPP
jgi:hypothetical protein